MHPWKAGDILDCIENDQSQNLANARYGVEPGERLDVMRFGTPGNLQFHLAEQFVIVIDEGDLNFYRLAHAGSGEVFFHSLAMGFVR